MDIKPLFEWNQSNEGGEGVLGTGRNDEKERVRDRDRERERLAERYIIF